MIVKTINKENSEKENHELTICIGKFDGFHLGHRKIIETAKNIAKKNKTKIGILTFDVPPKEIVKHKSHKILTSHDQLYDHLLNDKIDYFYILEFTDETSQLSPEDFIRIFLLNMGVNNIVCGEDFRFGHNAEGDITLLKKHFNVHVVDYKRIGNLKISSSKIKNCITNANIEKANEMLGRSYSVYGTIIHGNQLGKQIGFPTANILFLYNYSWPGIGVYGGKAHINDETYKCAISIGYNPTINEQKKPRFEVHILNFGEDIYHRNIVIDIDFFVREQKKFNNIGDLKKQLINDCQTINNFCYNYKKIKEEKID